ncbi:MAG: 30S ribosomal protein S12 methylthiotransferase RimO, partial [Candidatus Omnitrophota bacterium]|nr:30S ribosomal protein S12 methylthiotransferase RimO [Candidatus Omnitrophota bacterium]
MKTFSMISLGCPRNLVDSECIISEFKSKGYRYKEDIIGADIAVINTCAFIEDAKKESIDTILKLVDAKTSGDVKKIIVVGCLPERYKDELKKELPEIDEFRGILDFKKAPTKRTLITPKHYAYIKISEGCRNRCTYCIIPSIKGPYRSRPIV